MRSPWATTLLRAAALIALGAATVEAQAAGTNTVTFVDEAWQDPDLVMVRQALVQAAAHRDTAAMRPYLETQFLSSFGGSGGIEEFFGSLGTTERWDEFLEVMTMGGRFSERDRSSFTAPSWAAGYPCNDSASPAPSRADTLAGRERGRFRCADHGIAFVLGTNVRVRESPAGTPIAAVTRGVVAPDRSRDRSELAGGERWTAIVLPNGIRGWVVTRLLREYSGKRANFVKGADGRWRLRSFVAGD